MQPVIPSSSPFSQSTAYERDSQLHKLQILQLYQRLQKFRERSSVEAKTAKTMHDTIKRHYDEANGTSECERFHMAHNSLKRSIQERRMRQGPVLNMLSSDGAVLWECETSGPNGNTLFVFEAQLPDGQLMRVMYDSGASGNFVTQSFADSHKLHRMSCQLSK